MAIFGCKLVRSRWFLHRLRTCPRPTEGLKDGAVAEAGEGAVDDRGFTGDEDGVHAVALLARIEVGRAFMQIL